MSDELITKQARLLFRFGRHMRNQMLKVHMEAQAGMEGMLAGDLSPAQVHMLLKVQEQGESTISDLAGLLEVSPPSVSAMADRLVEKNVLVRTRSDRDRRVVVVRLSEQAETQMSLMQEAILSGFARIIKKVGPELAEKWCEVMAQVEKAIEKDTEDAEPT
ncbi:MAG: MarR family transcriptional regulator [Desulfobulbaceae bacterium]|nr:MAG: MarR family transcriptional regulator [Desulfobulbaceae bacterium]